MALRTARVVVTEEGAQHVPRGSVLRCSAEPRTRVVGPAIRGTTTTPPLALVFLVHDSRPGIVFYALLDATQFAGGALVVYEVRQQMRLGNADVRVDVAFYRHVCAADDRCELCTGRHSALGVAEFVRAASSAEPADAWIARMHAVPLVADFSNGDGPRFRIEQPPVTPATTPASCALALHYTSAIVSAQRA